ALHVTHVDRHEAVLLGDLAWHAAQELAREVDVVERHPRHRQLKTQALRKLRFADEATLEKDVAELLPRFAGLAQGLIKLIAREGLRLDEQLADELTHARNGTRVRAQSPRDPRATTRAYRTPSRSG